jgi:hypothetical protein
VSPVPPLQMSPGIEPGATMGLREVNASGKRSGDDEHAGRLMRRI